MSLYFEKVLEIFKKKTGRRVHAHVSTSSTSAVRSLCCIYCGDVIATCSAKYPNTKTYRDAGQKHYPDCARKWVRENLSDGEILFLELQCEQTQGK